MPGDDCPPPVGRASCGAGPTVPLLWGAPDIVGHETGFYIGGDMATFSGVASVPKSKSGQLADILRERVLVGHWSGALPAERALAAEFMVSRTTLRQALAILVRENLLQPPTTTRSGYQTLCAIGRTNLVATREVVFLTPTLTGSPVLSNQLSVLRATLAHIDLRIHVQEAGPVVEQKKPAAALKRLAARHPAAIWILHRMPRAIHTVFAEMRLPAVVFGSTFSEIGLPTVDIDFMAVGRHATGLCLSRGCRKFTLLINRTNLAGDDLVRTAITETLLEHGEPPPRIIRHDFNRARLIDVLDQTFPTRPDIGEAIVVLNQHHTLTVLSHLLRRGIRIPEDLSLVTLANDQMLERLSPLPYRYDSGPALVRKLATVVRALANSACSATCAF